MEEETSTSQEPPETQETPSLEQVAQEFSVEEQLNEFKATPVQTNSESGYRTQSAIPDPVSDPIGYENYMRNQADVTGKVTETLSEIVKKLDRFENQSREQQVKADLNRAVERVNDKWKTDPMLAESMLDKIYREDPSFQKIWNNREQNPKAFEKALDILSDKYASMFATVQDPQLIENHRAATASQRTMASTQKADPNEKWANLSDAEFEAEWNRTKGS